jgi:hypothetical protein
MKKALIGYQGWVQQIVEPGQDYDIYNGPDATIQWVDAPDEITLDWTLEYSPSQRTMIWVERDGPFTNNSVARKVAYGEYGQQLDMLFHEIRTNGTISQDGEWFQHVSAIKAIIPKSTEAANLTTPEEQLARLGTEEPSENRTPIPSTTELPAWKRYRGWRGFQGS